MAEEDRARQSVFRDRLFVKESGFLRLIFSSVPMFYGLSPRESRMRDQDKTLVSLVLQKILPTAG